MYFRASTDWDPVQVWHFTICGVWGSAHASGPAVVLIWKSYMRDGQVLSVRWTAGIFINRNNYYRKCYGCA